MTSKIKYVIVMSIAMILSLAIAIPSNGSIQAQEITKEPSYLEQAISKFKETQELDRLNTVDSEKLNSLRITYTELTVDNAEKRQIDQQIQNLENSITVRDQQISKKFADIDALEILNKKLYEVDENTKARLLASEALINDRYFNSENSENNPILSVAPYYKEKNLRVLVSPSTLDKQNVSQETFKQELLNLLQSESLEVELDVRYHDVTQITCSSRTTSCSTFLAGISAAGDLNNGLNTMGYKATKSSTVGFVMAKHSIDGDETSVVQPYNTSTVDGTVKEVSASTSNCDCAWVDSNPTMHNQIYKASNTAYTQNAKTNDSSQSGGTWVYKSGAATNVTLGEIQTNPTGSGQVTTVQIYIGSGDSGSPAFTLSGDNANIYGMFIGAQTGTPSLQTAYYQPQDFIASELGITTSTS